MADLLSVAMFKNIVNKSNVSNNNAANCCSSKKLNSKEESMLVGLLNKSQTLSSYVSSATKTTTSSSTPYEVANMKKVSLSEMIKPNTTSVKSASEVLNNMAKPVGVSTPQLGQKVDISSLAKGVKAPKAASASYDAKKNTTVTLNELAAKCKKSDNAPVETTIKVETGVKKSVIGNALGIEGLIPKISLNSIGKNNSFFK